MKNKLIHVLNKPKAKQQIEVWIDYEMDKDGWFLDLRYVEKKTKKVANSHCIIKKDLEGWLSYLERDNWMKSTSHKK